LTLRYRARSNGLKAPACATPATSPHRNETLCGGSTCGDGCDMDAAERRCAEKIYRTELAPRSIALGPYDVIFKSITVIYRTFRYTVYWSTWYCMIRTVHYRTYSTVPGAQHTAFCLACVMKRHNISDKTEPQKRRCHHDMMTCRPGTRRSPCFAPFLHSLTLHQERTRRSNRFSLHLDEGARMWDSCVVLYDVCKRDTVNGHVVPRVKWKDCPDCS
jgi:hypothetical protein